MRHIKSVLKALSSRVTLVLLSLLLQFSWYYFGILYLTENTPYFKFLMPLLALGAMLYIINQPINPAYKLTWSIVILTMPIVGIIFYFLGGKSRVARKYIRLERELTLDPRVRLEEDPAVRADLERVNRRLANQSRYLSDTMKFPLYRNRGMEYFALGEDWFAAYLEELRKARKYIFLEYFIIGEGYMWDRVLEILEERAEHGVDVRVIYDGIGSLAKLPNKYYRELQKKGIQCAIFNPFRPGLNIIQNNRDHRKITVIDGRVGFGGGINLADEYINIGSKFGHWKDNGFLIRGEAVWSLTVMFLKNWCVTTGIHADISIYKPHYDLFSQEAPEGSGFVQPYVDTPLDGEDVGENVYRNMVGGACRYCYIFTPYLILDNEMTTELCNAAKRGVDVRIVTPGIPDKRTIFLLTQSYYGQLLRAGVRIFEYSPGFLHAKTFVCDDEIAAVGTVNLDFRSLYLHFENGTVFYLTPQVEKIREDALATMLVSREVVSEEVNGRNIFVLFFRSLLRVFAPIL